MTNEKKNKLMQKNNENTCSHINPNDSEDVPSVITGDSSRTSRKSVSVCHIREDLKNVIETMGPSSLYLEETIPIGNTENEYTSISTSNTSKTVTKPIKDDDSQMTEYNVSEIIEYPNKTFMNAHVQTYSRGYCYPTKHYNEYSPENKRISRLTHWLRWKPQHEQCRHCTKQCDLYKINIEQQPYDDHSPPRRLVFDLMEKMPKVATKTIGTNTKCDTYIGQPRSEMKYSDTKTNVPRVMKQTCETLTQKVDIYYFDHGNAEYYRTTDTTPPVKTEYVAEKTDFYTKKFWAEFFGTFNIGVSFVISFILQLIRFILQAIIRPLTIGIVQLISDYFFKPCLAVTFNAVVQPPTIFLYNFITSIRDVCAPIADSLGYFIREISVLLKSVRIIQISQKNDEKKEKSTSQHI